MDACRQDRPPTLMSNEEPVQIRARGAGEVLDAAALLLRGRSSEFFRAALTAYLPWTVAINLLSVPWQQRIVGQIHPPPRDVVEFSIVLLVVLLLDVVLLRQFVRGILFAQGAGLLRGVSVSRRAAARHALRRLPSASLTTLITGGFSGLILILATLMATGDPVVVGGLMITMPLAVLCFLVLGLLGYIAVAVAQLERRGPLASVVRSFRLCGARPWTVVATALTLAIIHFFTLILSSLSTSLWVQSALTSAGTAFLVVLDVAVELHLYFSLRCTRENFDLDLLAREVGLLSAEEIEERAAPAPVMTLNPGHGR
jgi:hypothetical protein